MGPKQKENRELIEHIQDALQQHAEAYPVGAWENFQKRTAKPAQKVVPMWRWASVAAAVLVCLSVMLWVFKKPVPSSGGDLAEIQNTQQPDAPQVAESISTEETDLETGDALINKEIESPVNWNAKAHLTANLPGVETANKGQVEQIIPVQTVDQAMLSGAEQQVKQGLVETVLSEAITEVAQVEAVEASNAGDQLPAAPKTKANRLKVFNNNKWALGFVIAPSLSQNAYDLNVGYGLSVSYAVNNKLSINSGLAYNKMNASKHLPTNFGSSSIVMNNNKKLAVISEEVSGIDVPLEIKYQFSPKVYANVGLSGFAVINQQRHNTFVQDVVVTRSGASLATGNTSAVLSGPAATSLADPYGPQGQFANSYIVRQKVTEQVSSSALDNINFLGFYNFSVGYSRRIYKQNTIAIEPFFKLPVKEVTQDNLRMMGTGVRIKVGF